MQIKPEQIKKLRTQTGLGISECQKALIEAGGDYDKALALLATKTGESAASKADRPTPEGVVDSYIHQSLKVGAFIEVNCETDFVARNEHFKALVQNLLLHIVACEPKSVEELLAQPFVKDESLFVRDVIHQAVSMLGENISVARFCRYELGKA